MSLLTTASGEWSKFAATNLADLSFPSIIATATAPAASSTKAVIQWRSSNDSPNAILLRPYGTGADNTTFDMRLYGWRKVDTLYVPTLLLNISCTLSTDVGVSAQAVLNTERFADTITAALAPSTAEIVSPATLSIANVGGYVLVDAMGFDKLEITVHMTGATDANALYAAL